MQTSFVIDDRDTGLKTCAVDLIKERGEVHALAVAEQQRKAPKKHVRPGDNLQAPPPPSADDLVVRLRVPLDDLAVSKPVC
jgi:hypothetical protein